MPQPADIIIQNARVFTSDKTMPFAEAVAITGNRISYVGSNQGALGLKGKATRLMDGQGHTLTAGFIDSHIHLLSGATWMGYADLKNARSKEQLKQELLNHRHNHPARKWIVGWRAHYDVITTRQELDEIISDLPVYVRSGDAHTAWANTKALVLAGILRQKTAGEEDGKVLRDEDGVATGELRESGMKAVLDVIPAPDAEFIRAQLRQTSYEMNKAGITSLHNMNGDIHDFQTYAAAEDAGDLNLRVYVPFEVKPEMKEEDLKEAVEMLASKDGNIRGGAVKFFMDGVWESYTAFNIEPYADDPHIKVEPLFSLEHFTRMARVCDKLGLQIAVHCCGDAAVRQTLDGFEAVQKSNGRRDARHRIEHVEVCHPEDMPRFKKLDVIASIQLSHAPMSLAEAGVAQYRLGEARWKYWQPWRDLKNTGAMMAFGSDWTVVSFDPLTHIHAALNREKLSADSSDQRLTLSECLLGYTRDAAFVEFKENEKGQVKEGYLADLVLFSHDLFVLPPEQIQNAKAVLTIFDGKIVYEAE